MLGKVEQGCICPIVEEARAIRYALVKANKAGQSRAECQSDCKQLIKKLNYSQEKLTLLDNVLEDIRKLKKLFSEHCFSFIKRNNNYVGHKLAKFAIDSCIEIIWKESFPTWLLDAAKSDVMSCCST